VITGEFQPFCDLDVFKYVWNDTLQEWDEHIEVPIDSIVRFNISIHNNGMGTNILDIWAYDELPASLDYESGGATVNGVPYEPDYVSADLKEIVWYRVKIKVPDPIEKYVEEYYGSTWRIPKKI